MPAEPKFIVPVEPKFRFRLAQPNLCPDEAEVSSRPVQPNLDPNGAEASFAEREPDWLPKYWKKSEVGLSTMVVPSAFSAFL